ncbi:Uncharacterised protein [Mycobacteroides abscessus subsp. abscessus]|nr:Uncharacterised protein [Mycobacteroides abscessus subsp. abscessus]
MELSKCIAKLPRTLQILGNRCQGLYPLRYKPELSSRFNIVMPFSCFIDGRYPGILDINQVLLGSEAEQAPCGSSVQKL